MEQKCRFEQKKTEETETISVLFVSSCSTMHSLSGRKTNDIILHVALSRGRITTDLWWSVLAVFGTRDVPRPPLTEEHPLEQADYTTLRIAG